jgi:hypothetical protein
MNSDELAKETLERMTWTAIDWQAEVQRRQGETAEENHARLPSCHVTRHLPLPL